MNNTLFSRRFLSPLLSIAISVAALAQQPASQITPSAERLRSHVTYLASDALEGRRTGTPGADGAAQFIAGEFVRLGLKPGAPSARTPRTRGEGQSRFLQRFPYVAGVELGKNNVMQLIPQTSIQPAGGAGTATAVLDFRAGDDWMPLGFSSNGRVVDAPLAFVNYGITAPELNYDDYAGSRVAGYIAVAFFGTPDGDNPHGTFSRYEDLRFKAIAARNAGAKGLIVIGREANFKDDPLSRLRYDHNTSDAGLPVVAVSRQSAERILKAGGLVNSISELETAVREMIATSKKLGPTSGRDKTLEARLLDSVKLTLQADINRREVAAANVIGILEGSDPNLKNEAIVIGAHYDHLGRGGAGSLAQREGEVHHGADDNASGTAGLIELARLFSTQRPKPRRTIIFAAFSGEEEGLLGSNYYVNHPVIPLANTVAMINMDMIGRMKDRKLVIGGVGTAPEWTAMIEQADVLQGMTVSPSSTAHPSSSLPMVVGANGRTVVGSDVSKQFLLTLNEDGFGPSDHSSFYAKQIPVLFFWTGTHVDYHKPSDTAEKINYDDEVRILAMVARIIREVDASDKRPAYQVAKSVATGRSAGFRVYLGTIPNYADSSDGLLLDGVRDDSPAALAGLKAGDRIVKMAGRDVHNVYDYTAALGEMRAGQEYEVEIVRGTERLKLKLTPAARK
ncbi:MAG: M20/M25/M40 family metallo-hydrolase [Pyrinomonadaceae bacterium]|nr:M20/M25/M40 family metallo-hydrolase [Pyrinomonadaceae bacterium]